MHLPPTANLKNSKHVNLVLRAPGWDRKLAGEFLDWLATRSTAALTDDVKRAHLDELERRVAGKSLVSVSKESGVSLRDLRFWPNIARHFSYGRIKRPGLDLSFDIFNAGNELKLGDEPGGLVLEIFAVDGRTIAPLVELVVEAMRDWPVEYAFGGHYTFTVDYVLAHRRAVEAGRTLHVRDFLWPFTFSRDFGGMSEEGLRQLPVFRTGREAGGVWIWLFEDLSIGHNDHYTAAAEAFGLRSLWEQAILYPSGS
jgi:hypothetical protein